MMCSFQRICKFTAVTAALTFCAVHAFAGISAKRVVLSFDDGPHPKTTEKILEILRENKVPGTFFLVGKMIQKHPGLVKEIYQQRCEIGNHTYSDTRLTSLDEVSIRKALNSVNDLLEDLIGTRTSYFRPPGGRYNRTVLDIAHRNGYTTVLWTRYVRDTAYGVNSDKIFRAATVSPADKELIMMHDGPQETIKALPRIIAFYKKAGYEFTTISQVAAPMFKNSTAVAKKGVPQWPVFMWDSKNAGASLPVKPKGYPTGIFTIITAVASLGSTAYFIRSVGARARSGMLAPVFIGIRKESIRRLLIELARNGIRGTFFTTPEELASLDGLVLEELKYHDLAYLVFPGEKENSLTRYLNSWDSLMGKCGLRTVPFLYDPRGYGKKYASEIRLKGLLPVSWRLSLPDQTAGKSVLKKYFLSKAIENAIIPISGYADNLMETLDALIETAEAKNMIFSSVETYLMCRYRKGKI